MKKDRPGMILYFEDLQAAEELSDSELGQLVRLLMEYEQTGKKHRLKGKLGMAYAFMLPKLERDRDRYEKSCTQKSDAAHKRWEKAREAKKKAEEEQAHANLCETMQTHPVQCDAMHMHLSQCDAMHTMQKEKEKENENENEKEEENEKEHENEKEVSSAAQTCDAQGGHSGGDDGDANLSSELIRLTARYQELTQEHYQVVRENFILLCKQYSADWLSRAVECALKSGNVSIAYIRGILRNWAKAGKPDEREFRSKPGIQNNPALAYEQRTNDLEDLYVAL